MKEKSLLMKNEIRIIARYRALIVSKYYFILILSMITIYLSIRRLAPSSVYILLTTAVLPSILQNILMEYNKKHNHRFLGQLTKDQPFLLSSLKVKYHYTKINNVVNSFSYFIVIVLICLWQFSYCMHVDQESIIYKLPFISLITGLTLRFLAVIIYRIKFHHDLLYNKL